MITISTTLFNKMKTQAEAEYPHECCGGLLGSLDNDNKVVTDVVPIDNNWEDTADETKKRRFQITANDYQMLEKRAKDDGRTLLGFYHSHPDHPPIPSETDLKFAWPFFSYPILAIKKGGFSEIKSYELIGDALLEEPVEIKH